MIDRAFALWQAAYPSDWIEPWSEVGATFTMAHGTVEDSSSDLTPFYANTNGEFWDSDALRDTTVLNYNYADLASGESAADIINSLYRDNETPFAKRNAHDETSRPEYLANIRADTMSMEGSFTIYFFDGEFNETDPSSWTTTSSLLGTHGFFTGLEKKGDGSTLMNAGVSLNAGLNKAVKNGRLTNLNEKSVNDYLKENLEWRILMLDGTVVDEGDVPGLRVAITTSDVQIPASKNELPVWGGFRTLPDITRGRKCGFEG
jgi:tyrosinase